jgi:hypothetical protein
MTQFHALVGRFLPEDDPDGAEVVIGIETDRGPWVAALVTAGYSVFPVNPLQASRYQERHGVSRAKSDAGDAHMLAGMVRTDSRRLRAAAGDSPEAAGIKVLPRTHKTMIWERTRAVQRLRPAAPIRRPRFPTGKRENPAGVCRWRGSLARVCPSLRRCRWRPGRGCSSRRKRTRHAGLLEAAADVAPLEIRHFGWLGHAATDVGQGQQDVVRARVVTRLPLRAAPETVLDSRATRGSTLVS